MDADGRGPGRQFPPRWYALGVVCLAMVTAQVDITIVNVALSSIARDLRATTSDLQWIMDAYNIVLAGFVLLGGGLADRYGRKGIFLIGLGLFGVASLAAAGIAGAASHLIASRAAMGLGAALFMPAALSMLGVLFRPEERGLAISIWAAAGGFGTAIGPIIGGFLVAHFWWGSVSWSTSRSSAWPSSGLPS